MALLEAAVVTYLRTLLGSLDPYRAGAVLPQPWLGKVELGASLRTSVATHQATRIITMVSAEIIR